MICVYNDLRCIQQGYCNCYQDNFSEAAIKSGGILSSMLIGIPASFLYPAIRILRSNINYGTTGPKFAGGKWLAASPFFGLLGNMLYQVIFALGACAAGALQSKPVSSIYKGGAFVIFALAIGLAFIAFLIKNRQAIKLFIYEAECRTLKKSLGLAGVAVMGLLTAFAGLGAAFAFTDTYLTFKADSTTAVNREDKLVSTEAAKYDLYVGKYKLTTRDDKILFQITKSGDGKNLRLNSISGTLSDVKADSGCLLSPIFEEESIYYSVSECVVNGKTSPLAKVYFRIEKTKIKMDFVYNTRSLGDSLVKIK